MVVKGRAVSPTKKLTQDVVANIRRLIGSGASNKDLALSFGANQSTISRIRHMKAYL